MSATGLLSKGITLSYKDGAEFKNLPDLQEIPDMGADVEKVEVSTLADAHKRYIKGIGDYGDLSFKFLYSNEEATDSYAVLADLEDEDEPTEFQVKFPDDTTFTFDAFVSVKIDSAGVNAPLTFTANLALNSDIVVA